MTVRRFDQILVQTVESELAFASDNSIAAAALRLQLG
jgi:hypothetical protein